MKKHIYAKIKLALVFVICLITSGAFSQGVPELMYFKFDSAGNQHNYGSSAVGTNPAVLTGLNVGNTGQFGTALIGTNASSSSNRLSTGWATSLPSTGWTISMWISNLTSSTTLGYIFGDPGASSFRCFSGGVAGAGNLVLRGGGFTDVPITGISGSSKVIHMVYTGSAILIYKNGTYSNTVTQTAHTVTGSGPFIIGGYSSSAGLYTGALLDEFRMYNRALTATEIVATWNQSLPIGGDAGITAFVVPSDTVCSSAQPVTVSLKNFGTSALDSVKINWKVNNVAQPVFNWTGTLAGGNTANVVIGNYNFLSSTTYEVEASTSYPNGVADTDTTNDLSSKDSIYVKTGPTLTPALASLNSCMGDTIVLGGTLTGTGPWNIAVSDGFSTSNFNNISIPAYALSILPPSTVTYTLTVTDSASCTYYPEPTVDVTVHPLPPASITTTSDTVFCYGDTAILVANTGLGFTYGWQNNGSIISGATDSIFNAMPTGNYAAIVMDSNGCDATSNIIQVMAYALPVVNLGNDVSVGMAFNKVLDAGAGFVSYLWSTGDTVQTITVDTTGVGLGLATYWVHVTDTTCLGGDTINITWTTNPGFIELQSDNVLKVYPNPAKDKLFLNTTGNLDNSVVKVYDIKGQLIYSEKMKSNDSEINVSGWNRGMYLLKFHSDNYFVIKKLIIQ